MQTRKKSFNIRVSSILKTIGLIVLTIAFLGIFEITGIKSIIKNDIFDSSFAIFNASESVSSYFSDTSKKLRRAYLPESEYVQIGGVPIGIAINAGGLIVLGESPVQTQNGDAYPAKNSGIEKGDVIKSVNGIPLNSIYQLRKIAESKNLNELTFVVERDGRTFESKISPATDITSGQKRLGLMLKEDVGGVGTLTFVTQNGRFAALGHYIVDGESGLGEELNGGRIFNTEIEEVIKGQKGKAGGLVASVNRLSKPIGEINANTNIGLYGAYTQKYNGQLYRIAQKGEARIGKAQVFTTIEGSEPKFYDIDIVKVISQSEAGEKGMVIAVKDPELLEKTGGIVQGMSGSPIVQDGAIIGAVTHVFIQDPTRGYAVHSRFMLDYANQTAPANGKNLECYNLSLAA